MGLARGVYVLWLEAHAEVVVGGLGRWRLAGAYAYVGSAQGPGGFRRLLRHRDVADGRNLTRRWHIDFLLAAGTWRGAFVMETGDPSMECRLARALAQRLPPAIPRFGSSDCRCPTHLFALPDVAAFRQMMAELGLRPFSDFDGVLP
ncbi:GIY-YIG nuclease family protein [Thermoflexus sp.]|nr:GIY-YIG nuclease family protein [Thermoflexus sp.]MDW8180599.1 GIY-YIG nuclease family protein [Anaerolineae bacterium]MCS6964463.1 GIY-YIG nuclease family protein [Thermoflexus sp.]MCS7351146.1 GIY-YIG nuclease family protein [Thermoflexus sp.]MCX7690148.1 GIY-YIG nuclease family protein [Thermoflexus sp.]MDW8183905.1 GIY-YIG nuclease family protein [Anaerolineae bacterium]